MQRYIFWNTNIPCGEKLNKTGSSLPLGNRVLGSRNSSKNACAQASRGEIRADGMYSSRRLTTCIASGGVRGLNTCEDRSGYGTLTPIQENKDFMAQQVTPKGWTHLREAFPQAYCPQRCPATGNWLQVLVHRNKILLFFPTICWNFKINFRMGTYCGCWECFWTVLLCS